MALDNLVIEKIVNKLNSELLNSYVGEIIKISQNDYSFPLHALDSETKKRTNLIISMDNKNPLITSTDETLYKVNDNTPFFNILKKIKGTKLTKIEKLKGERIITLTFMKDNRGDALVIDDEVGYKLIVELFGNHPNLVMISMKTNLIVNIYKEKGDFLSENFIGKNTPYVYCDERKLFYDCETLEECQTYLSNKTFEYLSNYVNSSNKSLKEVQDEIFNSKVLYIIKNSIQPYHFGIETAIPIEIDDLFKYFNANQKQVAESLKEEKLKKELARLNKTIHKKIKNLQEDLEKAKKNIIFKDYGILLLNNQELYKPNMEQITLENQTIKLDPNLSAVENASAYFKKYHKAKQALIILTELIAKTEDEVSYLDNKLLNFDKATPRDLMELKEELVLTGYLKSTKKNTKGKKSKKPNTNTKVYKPHQLDTDFGTILFGMNDLQNESLTFKIANKEDIFVHIKDYPGAHILIRRVDYNKNRKNILELAGKIALYLSNVSSGEIQYCQITKVKKRNVKLGLVTLREYQTFFTKLDDKDLLYFKKAIK